MTNNFFPSALGSGDLDESKPLLDEALRIARLLDDWFAQFNLLDLFGCHAALSGQAQLAAQLLGAADTVRTEAGANVMPYMAPALAQAKQTAVAALGATRFEAEFAAGKQLSRDTALRIALGKSVRVTAAATGTTTAELLGKREADVARLVADGLTNKQIGARLFISERTVDSHVRSILNKLGFNSRAQIAAWMATLDQ